MSLELNLKVIRDGGGSPQCRLVVEDRGLYCACCDEEIVKDDGDICPVCQMEEAEYHEREVDDQIERKHGGEI